MTLNTYCDYLRKWSCYQNICDEKFRGRKIKVLIFTDSEIYPFLLVKMYFWNFEEKEYLGRKTKSK